MTAVAINTMVSTPPLRNISTRTNPAIFEKLRKLMKNLEPKHAQKTKPIVDKLQRFLYEEYDKVLTSFGGSTGKIPTLYELTLTDRKALDPLLTRISQIVQKAYVSNLNRKIRNSVNRNVRNKLTRERTEWVSENKTLPELFFSNVKNRMALATILRRASNMSSSGQNQNLIGRLRTLAPHIQTLIDIRRKIDTGNSIGVSLESAMRVIKDYRDATDAKYALFRGGDYPGVINIVNVNATPPRTLPTSNDMMNAILTKRRNRLLNMTT